MGNRILVIDDQKEAVDLFKEMLGQQGFTDIITAYSGDEGLKAVARQKPDVILLDILMPEMDGFMFYKAVKGNPATANIPVVVVTARNKMEDAFLSMGAAGFFAKPFDTGALISTVQKLAGSVPAAKLQARPQAAAADRGAAQRVLNAKKALVFGYHYPTLDSISSVLRQKGYATTVVEDERQVSEYAGAIGFDLAFMELYVSEDDALDRMIELFQVENRTRKAQDVPVVIYKTNESTAAGIEVVDIDNLLERCRDLEGVRYIGDYSSATFLNKIKDLIGT